MKILGIETSCDETAAAVVEDGKRVLSSVVASSIDLHVQYGGVVPEIAARSHIEHMMPVVEEALEQAFPGLNPGNRWGEVDAIAVTEGPGLGGSLLVGVLTARTLAITKNKPLYGVNHVMAHPYATFLTLQGQTLQKYDLPEKAPEFPILALIVSGGHSQIVLFKNHFDYQLLGQTRDDAIGEAFDKVAKILGLPYPGGPSISKAALKGDPRKFKLPKSQMENPYDMSFSGLKTAVLRALQAECGKSHDFPSHMLAEHLSESQKNDMAASFQTIAVETVVDKVLRAVEEYKPKSVVVAGGVAANQELRRQLDESLELKPIYPDMKLCTDNAAMIAALGYFMAKRDVDPADPYLLDISPNLSM